MAHGSPSGSATLSGHELSLIATEEIAHVGARGRNTLSRVAANSLSAVVIDDRPGVGAISGETNTRRPCRDAAALVRDLLAQILWAPVVACRHVRCNVRMIRRAVVLNEGALRSRRWCWLIDAVPARKQQRSTRMAIMTTTE